MKKQNNNVNMNKNMLWFLITFFVIISIIYFAKCYIYDSGLVFTSEDEAILIVFSISVLFIAITLIYLILRTNKLENVVIDLFRNIVSIEDNLVNVHRNTQNMIMNLSKKFGVGDFEKKS